MSNKYPLVSAGVFGIVAVIHAVRALNHWSLSVATMEIPVWCSWVAALGAGAMCLWAFRSARA